LGGLTGTALEQFHDNMDIMIERAFLLGKLMRYDESICFWQKIVTNIPQKNPFVLNNLGCTLTSAEYFAEAITPLEEAVSLDPAQLEPRLNLGYAYTYLGEYDKAMEQFDAILKMEPENLEARWYRCHLLLGRQRFDEGWPEFETRIAASAVGYRPHPYPLWHGEPLDDKSVLIAAEQGVGDEIMFASCVPDLISRVAHCILECDNSLISLMERSFPGITVVGKDIESRCALYKRAPLIHCQIRAGSLPGIFRRSLADFPDHRGYMCANELLVKEFRERLKTLGDGLRIGISWRGGTANSRMHTRSMNLTEWKNILEQPRCQFVSLQYGNSVDEILDTSKLLGVKIYH
jgi:Tfp pilus assembly protein PilF